MAGRPSDPETVMTLLRLAAAIVLCWVASGCQAIDADPILGTRPFQPGETFKPPARGNTSG